MISGKSSSSYSNRPSATGERRIPVSLRSLCKLAFTALAFWLINPCHAQANPFVGQWSGVFQGITISYTMDANFNYSNRDVSGALQTAQSGKFHLAAPNQITFEVVDWAPKTQPVYHPTGTTGGYYTQQPMAKAVGGSFSYIFKSANTLVLTDLATHGVLTLNRVP
jgi:hypothetical protein